MKAMSVDKTKRFPNMEALAAKPSRTL